MGGVLLGMTGASGSVYGIRLLEELKKKNIETHLILSHWAKENILLETGYTVEQVVQLASYNYDAGDLSAPVASGSYQYRCMVVAPCSMKSLAAIAIGYADNLLVRAADVCIKEGRKLILLTRETPLSTIHLENMLKLSRLGVTIMPPVPSFYQRPETIDDLVRQTVGRVLDIMDIQNELVKRWEGSK